MRRWGNSNCDDWIATRTPVTRLAHLGVGQADQPLKAGRPYRSGFDRDLGRSRPFERTGARERDRHGYLQTGRAPSQRRHR